MRIAGRRPFFGILPHVKGPRETHRTRRHLEKNMQRLKLGIHPNHLNERTKNNLIELYNNKKSNRRNDNQIS